MSEKIDLTKDFTKAIQQFIDANCKKYGFEIDELESSLSNGYSPQIERYSIRMGLYLKLINVDLEEWREIE